MADKKFIDGLPADGVSQPLPEGDRSSGTTDWLQFRSYWGEHPQRNEVRILDDDITLTDSFGVDGRVRGGRLPKSGGGSRPNDFKAGLTGGLIVGVLSLLVAGFAVTRSFLEVQTFQYPADSGNWIDVGVATGSSIMWVLAFAGLMLAGLALRSFVLKDRALARSADKAIAVLGVVTVVLSLTTVGPSKLPETLDLIPDWSTQVTESAKARINEYVVGPIDPNDQAEPLQTKDGKGVPYRKAIIGVDRCGDRDDKGNRSGKCAGMEQIVAEATAELDKVAAEIKLTDQQTCLVTKAAAQEYVKLRQDKKKASLPECALSEQQHRVMTGLNGKFKKVQLATWARERDGVVNSLIETRLALAKRRYALEAAKALKLKEEHTVSDDAVNKIRKAWRTAAEAAFASTDKSSTTAVGYDGGVLCRWVQPSEDAIKAAKKERKPKPEPTASCGKAKRSHAEYKAYTSESDYQAFKATYGALAETLMDRPADPAAKQPKVDPNKPQIPTLLAGDQRSVQIVGLDIAEGVELGAKDKKLLVDGLTRRFNSQKGRVFTAVVSGEMGVPANVRPYLFVESKDWGKAISKAEKAKKASGEHGITCREDENDKEGSWLCKRPEYGEAFKSAGADLVALMRLHKHETNGLTLGVRIVDKKDASVLYKDGNAIADIKKIGKDAGPLFDRVVLAWSMKEKRLAEERSRNAVSQEVMRLRDRVSQSQSDNGRIEGAYNHIASTLIPFIDGAAKDLPAIIEAQGAANDLSATGQYKIERSGGYAWIGLALVLCLLALGVNLGTREVLGKDLARVTSGGQIDLSGVDMGRAAVWDGNAILSGDALGDRRSGNGLTLRSGEVVAFRHGGAAYTVRYISNNLDTPPGEFQEEVPTAEMLADVHPDFTPNPSINRR